MSRTAFALTFFGLLCASPLLMAAAPTGGLPGFPPALTGLLVVLGALGWWGMRRERHRRPGALVSLEERIPLGSAGTVLVLRVGQDLHVLLQGAGGITELKVLGPAPERDGGR